MKSADRAHILGLKRYLEQNVDGIAQVVEGWPDRNIELEYPSISIINMGNPTISHVQPYIYEVSGVKRKIPDDSNINNDIVDFVVGYYENIIQVDIWAEYKAQRGTFFDLVQAAFDKDFIDNHGPTGLSLVLTEYYDVIARFDQLRYNYVDSEDSTQRSEWRVKMDIQVHFPKIIQKSVPRINETVVINQIGDNNNVEEDKLDIEEEYQV